MIEHIFQHWVFVNTQSLWYGMMTIFNVLKGPTLHIYGYPNPNVWPEEDFLINWFNDNFQCTEKS